MPKMSEWEKEWIRDLIIEVLNTENKQYSFGFHPTDEDMGNDDMRYHDIAASNIAPCHCGFCQAVIKEKAEMIVEALKGRTGLLHLITKEDCCALLSRQKQEVVEWAKSKEVKFKIPENKYEVIKMHQGEGYNLALDHLIAELEGK